MDLKQFTLLIGAACLPGMTTAATVYRTISKVRQYQWIVRWVQLPDFLISYG